MIDKLVVNHFSSADQTRSRQREKKKKNIRIARLFIDHRWSSVNQRKSATRNRKKNRLSIEKIFSSQIDREKSVWHLVRSTIKRTFVIPLEQSTMMNKLVQWQLTWLKLDEKTEGEKPEKIHSMSFEIPIRPFHFGPSFQETTWRICASSIFHDDTNCRETKRQKQTNR